MKLNDIEKTHSKILHKKLNKPEFNLKNKDIEKSFPKLNKFETIRSTNPLNPNYNLPKIDKIIIEEPKFIRDNINIDDIEGTKPKALQKKIKIITKTNFIDDIEKVKPNKEYNRKKIVDSLEVKDINEYRIFKTKRHINPLNPNYIISDENKVKKEIGEIDKNKPKILHPNLNKQKNFSLNCLDIKGSQKSTTINWLRLKNKRHFQVINKTSDINGAKVGTLKNGLITKRCTNPLNPQYYNLNKNNNNFSRKLTNCEVFDNYIKNN